MTPTFGEVPGIEHFPCSIAVFPTSFFLLAPYSESLFLFLVLFALWAARRGKWELAGLAGIGASATRNIGVLLVLPLLTEAFHRFRERRKTSELARGVTWSLVAAGGAVAYLAFWQNLFAAACLAPIVAGLDRMAAWPTLLDAGLLLVLGVAATGVAHTLFIASMQRVSAHTASIVAALEPVYGIALAVALLHEVPGPRTLFGGALIVAAALIASRRIA